MSQAELSVDEVVPSLDEKPPLDPHPLSPYVAWAGKRNRGPILNFFKERFPQNAGTVLELASGSGFHINYFASHFPNLIFQPSDLDEGVFEKIRQTIQETGVENVNSPIKIDLITPETWSDLENQTYIPQVDKIFPICMLRGNS